jgi:hypothetical protein
MKVCPNSGSRAISQVKKEENAAEPVLVMEPATVYLPD